MDIIIVVNDVYIQKIDDGIKRNIILSAIPAYPIGKIYLYARRIKMVVGYIEINSFIKKERVDFNHVTHITPRGLGEFGLKRLHGPFTYSRKVER